MQWKETRNGSPISIEIHPTNMCNLNCIMCGTRLAYRNKKKINPDYDINEDTQFEVQSDRWLTLIKEAYVLGVKKWLLTGGGEPMLRKDIVLPLVKEVKRYGMYGNINTNGTLFDEHDTTIFVKNRWDMVMFSLDSATEETHDKIRGVNGTYNNVLNTINRFNRAKKMFNISEPKLTFNTILCNKNYDTIKDLIHLAHELKCTDITFIPLIKFGNFKEDLLLTEEQQEEIQKELPSLVKFASKKRVNTNLCTFERAIFNKTSEMDTVILSKVNKTGDKFLSIPCYSPFLNLVVRMDGKISPCCMLENHKENIKNKSLKEVWFGAYFTELRRNLTNRKLHEDCKTCVHSQFIHNQRLRKSLEKCVS